MKKTAFFLFLVSTIANTAVFAETYSVNTAESEVKWTATKVTGKHFGKINVTSGAIEFTEGQFSGGEAVIDAASLTVEDLQGSGKEKLTKHLKSADFFDVEQFPSAAIKITEVKTAGENLYDVTADLTIKNITKPAAFQARVEKTDAGISATAMITVDRTAYDIRYGSGKFFENLGDKTIHDDFALEVTVSAA